VLVTEVNSHAAVLKAKDILRRSGRRAVFLHKASKSRILQLLDELSQGLSGPAPCPC